MGRLKKFSREGVLEKAIPVFWDRGFADTSVQDLEFATGVNKSGLYKEFAGKEDLFLASLRHYLDHQVAKEILSAEPLGWNNIEKFLKLGHGRTDGRTGCFSVNSMREFAVLPPQAQEIVAAGQSKIRALLLKNIQAEKPKTDTNTLADLIAVFFSGLCIEQNLAAGRESGGRKVDALMRMIRAS